MTSKAGGNCSDIPIEKRLLGSVAALTIVKAYGNAIAELEGLQAAKGPSWIKRSLAVLTLVQLFSAIDHSATWSAQQAVLDLLPPMSAKLFSDCLRGLVAAAVAALRAATMENPDIETWLGKEIADRGLDFTPQNAVRWWRDATDKADKKISAATIEVFNKFDHDPAQPLTETEAKRRAATILGWVAVLKVTPLTRPRRGR